MELILRGASRGLAMHCPKLLLILIYQDRWGERKIPAFSGCEITYDRDRWQDADALVFHIPQLSECRFPPRKLPGQFWIGWSMESEINYPLLARRSELASLFDFWMTYHQDSDIWCPYLETQMIDKFGHPVLEKTAPSPAAAFISSPFDQSGRVPLLESLMQEMPIDSYGKILRNCDAPVEASGGAKRAVVARYKFTIAFENPICTDYVTEKFFDPLLAGSVPVYLGAPNVEEFAPGDHCYIDASRFDGPRALARHLMALANDDALYAELLWWKSRPLRPSFRGMIDKIRTNPFERLAKLIGEERARGTAPEAATPSVAFS